ncbi:MAG: sulfotransferase [Mariprofundus sp.]|nr:sulfotransferase [Mariprofundus sp.]
MKLSNNSKRKIEQWLNVAKHSLNQGDIDAVKTACNQIETLCAKHPDLMHLRGLMALREDDTVQAAAYLAAAVEAAPLRADILASKGNVYLQVGDVDAAMHCYQSALKIDPMDMATHLGLASGWMVQEQYDRAIAVLERAKKRKPGEAAIRMGLFQACRAANRNDEARGHLEAIITRDGNSGEAHYGLAVLAVERGELDMARKHLYDVLQIAPFHADAWLVLADLHHFDEEDEEVEAMRHVYQQCEADSDSRMKLAFALAKVNDDLGDYEHAFSLLEEANAIRHKHASFDIAAAVAALAEVRVVCTPLLMEACAEVSQVACLFVVGMPRSGSSLVEQIISSHERVVPLGENGHLAAAIEAVVGADKTLAELNALSNNLCAKIGHVYVERIKRNGELSSYYCDKTLSHIGLMGLIHRALPQARFVHVCRHPLDSCLSIFKNNLQGEHFAYGFDLSELAQYYAAYQQLMAHWRDVLPAELFYELAYEALVADQEVQTRALLAACELSWDASCLHFYQSKRAVQTASAVQVRRPISSASVGVWKNYAQQLKPLVSLCKMEQGISSNATPFL